MCSLHLCWGVNDIHKLVRSDRNVTGHVCTPAQIRHFDLMLTWPYLKLLACRKALPICHYLWVLLSNPQPCIKLYQTGDYLEVTHSHPIYHVTSNKCCNLPFPFTKNVNFPTFLRHICQVTFCMTLATSAARHEECEQGSALCRCVSDFIAFIWI